MSRHHSTSPFCHGDRSWLHRPVVFVLSTPEYIATLLTANGLPKICDASIFHPAAIRPPNERRFETLDRLRDVAVECEATPYRDLWCYAT